MWGKNARNKMKMKIQKEHKYSPLTLFPVVPGTVVVERGLQKK